MSHTKHHNTASQIQMTITRQQQVEEQVKEQEVEKQQVDTRDGARDVLI